MRDVLTLDGLVREASRHWKRIGAACLAAAAIAGAISMTLPKQYTAVVRLMVEAGPRNPLLNATGENPQLLARLASYDQLVRSDSLFEAVALRTGLDAARSVEQWKRDALATSVLPQPRVVEIRFTHPLARKAHEVAVAVAQEAVNRSEEARRAAAVEMMAEAGEKHEEARSWAIFRGDHLRLLDAGIVPSEPSSPRVLLNMMGAALLTFSLSSAGVLIQYALRAGHDRG